MIYKMITYRNINDVLHFRLSLFHILIFILTINSCSTVSYESVYPTLRDGKYDSEFPYKGSSDELERITQTVQRITSTGFYKTYFFNRSDEVTMEKIRNSTAKELFYALVLNPFLIHFLAANNPNGLTIAINA